MSTATERLTVVATRIAAESARRYLVAHKLIARPYALTACLASWVKLQLPIALKDAKEALDCGMGKAAEATFAASMILAGIEAAKEAGYPVDMTRAELDREAYEIPAAAIELVGSQEATP